MQQPIFVCPIWAASCHSMIAALIDVMSWKGWVKGHRYQNPLATGAHAAIPALPPRHGSRCPQRSSRTIRHRSPRHGQDRPHRYHGL
eukprot:16141168-Heterocapsa_arctica.AAC.1